MDNLKTLVTFGTEDIDRAQKT